MWLAGSQSNNNGVAILFNNAFQYELHNGIRDADGCFIIIGVEILKKRVTVINVYGPSSGDKPEVLKQKWPTYRTNGKQISFSSRILERCVEHEGGDTKPYKSNVGRPRARKGKQRFD